MDEEQAQRAQYLKDRDEERTRKKREQLRKVAPGWEPDEASDATDGAGVLSPGAPAAKRQSAILEPTRRPTVNKNELQNLPAEQAARAEEVKPRDVMDDLVEGLARMDELEGRKGL